MNGEIDFDKEVIEELKKKYLVEVVQPSFPFISYFGGTSYKKSYNGKPELIFSQPRYYDNKENEYCFSDSNKFIHYTSLKNSISIINDGFFRLNSLAYMDDPQELLYAGNELLGNYEPLELDALKKDAFSISMCEYDENDNTDNFDSWRLYGYNGKGVGIVFNFSSDVKFWSWNYLSRIYYGKEKTNIDRAEVTTEKFRTFKINHDRFIKENEGEFDLYSSLFGRKGKIPEWIAIYLAFHKSSLYTIENEIRFLTRPEHTDRSSKSFTLNENFEKTYYDRLLIKSKKNLNDIELKHKGLVLNGSPEKQSPEWIRQFTQAQPIVEIEKIIIGYRHLQNFEKIKKAITDGFSEKTGFSVNVELSSLAEAFK